MRRNRVQYRGAIAAASSLRPSACASPRPIPTTAVCSACRPALPPRWRASRGAPVGASGVAPCLHAGLRPAPAAGCAGLGASPPPRPAAGSPPARARGTLLRRASAALRATSGAAPLADPPPGYAGRGPLGRPPRAPAARAPAGCGTGCPAPLRAGGDGGFAPHARPARLGAPRGRGAPDGHPATGRCAPSALRAVAAHPACPTRVRARLPPAPGACAPGRGCAPRFAAPPRQGLRPRHPTGAGAAPPPPYPHPLLALRRVIGRAEQVGGRGVAVRLR